MTDPHRTAANPWRRPTLIRLGSGGEARQSGAGSSETSQGGGGTSSSEPSP